MKTIITTITTGAVTGVALAMRVSAENHNLVIRSQMDDLTEQIQALRAQRSELKAQLIEL